MFVLFCFLQKDFFIILHDILVEMEEVSELQPVPNAYVPVMKFKICGISVDLLYASISLLVVPEVSWTRSCFCTSFLFLPNHSKLKKDMPFCFLFFPSLCY